MTTPHPDTPELDDLRQKLAAIEHERWADWQKWCHEVIRETRSLQALEMVLDRWDKQIETPYAELSDREKASDMEQVDRYWPLITRLLAKRELEGRIDVWVQLINTLRFVIEHKYQETTEDAAKHWKTKAEEVLAELREELAKYE